MKLFARPLQQKLLIAAIALLALPFSQMARSQTAASQTAAFQTSNFQTPSQIPTLTSPVSPSEASEGPSAPGQQAELLPDAPGALLLNAHAALDAKPKSDRAGAAATSGLGSVTPEASRTQEYIEAGQSAPKLTANDKVLLGVRDAFSLFSATGWLASAVYEQVLDGSPNYGTDSGAFGQRLGASAIRASSETIFTESILSPILREDTRYYRLGPTHPFLHRALYAATRPLIARTDGGRLTPNLALIAGNVGGAALTNLYYPQVNRGFSETLETFGGSMGGSAIGDVVSEFYDDIFHHHRHR